MCLSSINLVSTSIKRPQFSSVFHLRNLFKRNAMDKPLFYKYFILIIEGPTDYLCLKIAIGQNTKYLHCITFKRIKIAYINYIMFVISRSLEQL